MQRKSGTSCENIIEGYMIDYTYKIRYNRNQSRIIVIFEVL